MISEVPVPLWLAARPPQPRWRRRVDEATASLTCRPALEIGLPHADTLAFNEQPPGEPMSLSFGVTVLPDPLQSRLVELIQLAESNGFEYGWTYDSHVLWQESFPLLTLAVQATSTMKFGHCVTNPGTREPTVLASGYATLQDISDGRMVMGIGRGDSARRFIGQKPVTVAEFERRLAMIKDFMNGREVDWNEKELQLKWVREELPRSRCTSRATGRRRSRSPAASVTA